MRGSLPGLLFLVGLVACTGTQAPKDWWLGAGDTDDREVFDRAAFASAAKLLDGIDEPTDRTRIGGGDCALFGVELREEGAEPSRFLLRVTVKDAVAQDQNGPLVGTIRFHFSPTHGERQEFVEVSKASRLLVSRHGLDGTEQAASALLVVHTALQTGFVRTCEVFAQHPNDVNSELTSAEAHDIGLSITSLQTLLDMIQADAQLSDLLQRVAKMPSLISIVGNLGVSVGIQPDFTHARHVEARGGDAWRVPLTVTANDQPAVLVLADVVTPGSPLNLSAGVVRLTARRPGEDRARLVLELLAARRKEG
ncbi:MAG: hypothetical protein U1F36_23810 [Planctomycetota bacterium]